MARSKGNTNASKRWSYTDEKGRFVSKNYEGKVYKNVDGKRIFIGYKVPSASFAKQNIKEINSRRKIDDYHEPYSKTENKTVFVDNSDDWRLRDYSNAPIKEKSSDEKFVFSYNLQKKFGITKDQQRKIYELFKEANQKGEEYRELTDDLIGAKFSYNLDSISSFTQLEKRIKSAKNVLSDSYLSDLAKKYKTDFKTNFSNLLDKSTVIKVSESGYEPVSEEEYKKYLMENFPDRSIKEIYEMMEKGTPLNVYGKDGNIEFTIKNITDAIFDEVDSLTDVEFLSLLKRTKNDMISYALESIMDTYGYESVINELLYIGGLIRSGKGKFF